MEKDSPAPSILTADDAPSSRLPTLAVPLYDRSYDTFGSAFGSAVQHSSSCVARGPKRMPAHSCCSVSGTGSRKAPPASSSTAPSTSASSSTSSSQLPTCSSTVTSSSYSCSVTLPYTPVSDSSASKKKSSSHTGLGLLSREVVRPSTTPPADTTT
ncbi:hypothetical protein TSOC_012500 [Tetrabaena socialis]|uniref:Uncharacterized protein n=1 Tax=Tetrabaena socialis TaxID=47790 RepID=A0A2J7ZMV7_9CHLO|nr:hypothetical protein TSOC_012500 [Tetrabaena socialis]|eukprot:PNH01598.1 hypothetical protein TSOC_012500 [Tetrabaena socialis]